MDDRRWAFGAARSLVFVLVGLPAAALAAGECAPAQGAPPLCLDGTVTAEDYSVALIEEAGSKAVKTVHPGESVGGWEVAEIGARHIVMQHDDESVRIDLDANAPEPEPAVAAKPSRPVMHPRSRPPGRPVPGAGD